MGTARVFPRLVARIMRKHAGCPHVFPGPIPVAKDSELYIYYPEGPWLAAVMVGGIR